MIVGIGTDIVRVSRIRGLLERYPNFVTRVFSDGEIDYCRQRSSPEQSYAARFAAKEALVKACGASFTFSGVSVINDDSGKPYFSGDALAEISGGGNIHLSISHDTDYAVAFVVIERTVEKSKSTWI